MMSGVTKDVIHNDMQNRHFNFLQLQHSHKWYFMRYVYSKKTTANL